MGGGEVSATFYVGDSIQVMNTLPEKSVDLILTSPPFLALRSYLPQDHPDKALEGGSQATPGAYIDWLLDVVEACARVLAPHGSLCFELGDTYSGSGGAGGDYNTDGLREGQPTWDSPSSRMESATTAEKPTGRGSPAARTALESWKGVDAKNRGNTSRGTARNQRDNPGTWPLAKSLSLIPESFRFAMVYGHNPFTGRQTEPWRLRNVIRWVRPNPPVGALGDKFRPATSELMVFCKSKDRFFDLDAVRTEHQWPDDRHERTDAKLNGRPGDNDGFRNSPMNPAGAPPLDWWNIPPGGYPGAHYAVWPPELLVKPIKAMCPEKVCRRCGEPQRRIVSQTTRFVVDERQSLADYLRERREAAGVSMKELARNFPSVSGGITGCVSNWENAANVPTADQWPILKRLLTLDDRFDSLVIGERIWQRTEGLAEYEAHGDPGRQNAEAYALATMGQNPSAQGMSRGRATKIPKDAGFSDCGHDNYRPGLVLDPFAGSGTTLAVATGHGRDAIGIDLDERNYELALDRVGPLVLSRAA